MPMQSTADIIRRKRGLLPPDDTLSRENDELVDSVELPQMPEPDPADVEQAAAMLEEQEAAGPRPGSVQGRVGQAVLGAAPQPQAPQPMAPPEEDDEVAAAHEADRKSRFTAGMELAGRQLVGGITRTPVSQGIGAAPSQVPGAMAAAKSRQERAAEVVRAQRQAQLDSQHLERQGRQDERQGRMDESEMELRRAKIAALVRGKTDKSAAAGDELESYKAVMSKRYPQAAELIAGLTTMKGAQDLQNSLDAEMGRGTTIEAAKIAAQGSRYEASRVRADAKVDRDAENEDKQVAELAKVSGSDVAMGRKALDEVDAEIAKYGEDIPGVGTLKSKAYDWMLSDEGNKNRQNANDALAIMLSVRSGATVSPEELERSKGIYGVNGSPKQFAEGMKRLRRDFESTLAAKQAGYGPKVKEKFAERGGTLASSEAPQIRKPVKYLVSPDKKRRVPVYADGSKGPEEANGGR